MTISTQPDLALVVSAVDQRPLLRTPSAGVVLLAWTAFIAIFALRLTRTDA